MKSIRKKFCPKCGREADKLYDGMCVDCFFEKKRTIEIPKRILVKRCKRCGKYFAGKVVSERIDDVVGVEVKKISGLAKPAKTGIKAMNYGIANSKVYLSLKFDFEGMQKSEEHEIELHERSIVCQYCAMAGTHYYNAILQIRAPEQIIDKILTEVRERIAELKSDRMAFIADVKKMKNGIDVHIGSKAAAAKTAKAINKKFEKGFSVSTKTTSKLAGRKEGKNVYRDTILIIIE